MTLIGLLIVVLIAALLWWALQRIVKAFSIQEPIAGVLEVVFIILLVLWLLGYVGPLGHPIKVV